MSKPSATSATKNVPQLPHKSAWSRGPPQSTSSASTPRSQSPAPNATPPTSASHSRRPSTLGSASGVSYKEGVGAARSPTSTVKPGKLFFPFLYLPPPPFFCIHLLHLLRFTLPVPLCFSPSTCLALNPLETRQLLYAIMYAPGLSRPAVQ